MICSSIFNICYNALSNGRNDNPFLRMTAIYKIKSNEQTVFPGKTIVFYCKKPSRLTNDNIELIKQMFPKDRFIQQVGDYFVNCYKYNYQYK